MNHSYSYYIKKGYKTNIKPGWQAMPTGNDTVEDSKVFQWGVYQQARDLIIKNGLNSVLDLGCGMGMKLAELIHPICTDIVGVDEANTIASCRRMHSFGKWHVDNLEDSKLNMSRTFDLIIAADLIEHLVDPDQLLALIRKCACNETYIVFSTPDRDICRGQDHMGPSPNSGHAREWNFPEFGNYIKNRGFQIIDHFHCPVKKEELRQTDTKISLRILKATVVSG